MSFVMPFICPRCTRKAACPDHFTLQNQLPSFLSRHCIFCMNTLADLETRPNGPPICTGCRMALQMNPGSLTSVKAGAAAVSMPRPAMPPVPQPDPYGRYRLQHPTNISTRDPQLSIPHFNSRGELIVFPESQVVRICDAIILFFLH